MLHSCGLAHAGGINRLCAMPQQPGVIAAWADTGAVQVCSETRVPTHRQRGLCRARDLKTPCLKFGCLRTVPQHQGDTAVWATTGKHRHQHELRVTVCDVLDAFPRVAV